MSDVGETKTAQEYIEWARRYAVANDACGDHATGKLFADLASLIESLAAAAVTVLPIESAPKDELTINTDKFIRAWWPDEGEWYDTWWDETRWESSGEGGEPTVGQPTHFYYDLPAPTEPNP